jgi:Lipid A 3-O-deacylase (PagL)
MGGLKMSPSTRVGSIAAVALLAGLVPAAGHADDCHCKLLLGVGATYQLWGWSDGLVVPITLELADSRWEAGAYWFPRRQIAAGYGPPDKTAANPYWGFTAMRRWQFLHRPWGRLYFGFGANYRDEIDYLEPTRWNFAYLVAARFYLGAHGPLLEFGVRHWSDAWIKKPNRGQDFVTLSVGFPKGD